MKLRYALLALLFAPSIASAQLSTRAEFPEIIINSPASIAARMSTIAPNFGNIPRPPYTLPDTTGGLPILGTSVFFYVAASGDSVSMGVNHTAVGVTADFALALTSEGAPALGCLSATDSTSDVANGADLAGRIAMVQRGVCPFYLKGKVALDNGALGFLVFNPSDRDPDTAINMAGGAPGNTPITIPGAFLPWDLAEPIFNAVASGETVNATMRCDASDDGTGASQACNSVAAEGGPSAAGAGLFLAGQNPTSTVARLVVRTPAVENVTVIAYNMLGQEVARLYSGAVLGEQVVTLQAGSLPSGSYFVRATGQTFTQTQQVTIVR